MQWFESPLSSFRLFEHFYRQETGGASCHASTSTFVSLQLTGIIQDMVADQPHLEETLEVKKCFVTFPMCDLRSVCSEIAQNGICSEWKHRTVSFDQKCVLGWVEEWGRGQWKWF